jgi:outer membrane protein assembly factor BamB
VLPNPRSFHRALALASFAIAVLAGMGAPGASAQTADASAVTWSQFQGDAAHTGSLSGSVGASEPPYEGAWAFEEPDSDRGLSAPVIVRDVAIAVGSEAVYGVDLAGGEQVWRVERDGGPIAEPAVAERAEATLVLYTEGDDAETSKLVAIDASDQRAVWNSDLGAVTGSGVTVEGDTAFVGDDDGTLHAIDLKDGSEAWRSEGVGRIEPPPAVTEGLVFVSSRELSQGNARIRALDASSGEQQWEFSQEGLASGSAISVAEGRAIAGFTDRLARAFDAESGTGEWASLLSSAVSPRGSAATVPGSVYLVDLSGTMVRLDAATGDRVWDYRFNASRSISIPYLALASSPVVTGSSVLIGLSDGRLAAVSTETGHLVWQSDTGPGALGGIALSPEVVIAAKGGANGGLVAFRHDDAGTLIDEPSPTELDPAELASSYAIAFTIVFLAIVVPFRLLGGRARRTDNEPDRGGA